VRLFISHSARTTAVKRVLETVQTILSADHEVFVDKQIDPGAAWRSVIYHQLATCDGAVVLLDRHALASRWVQREVDLLLWRQAFHERLTVVAVLLGSVSAGSVGRAGFEELDQSQFLFAGRDGLDPDAIAERLSRRFVGLPTIHHTRMEQWFADIALALEEIRHPERLRDAALALGVTAEEADRVLHPGGSRFLAHQFLGQTAGRRLKAVHALVNACDQDLLKRLVGLIRPTWVHASAARPLLAHRRAGRMVAVLNARQSRTAVQYVQRATCVDRMVKYEEVAGVTGEPSAAELLAQGEKAVLRLLGGDPELGHTFDDIREDIVRHGRPHARHLIINATVAPKPAVAEAVRQLIDRFPWLVVIVVIGKTAPSREELARWRLGEGRVLEPVLGDYDEVEAWRDIDDLDWMIAPTAKGTDR
jgi:hypothetical protein